MSICLTERSETKKQYIFTNIQMLLADKSHAVKGFVILYGLLNPLLSHGLNPNLYKTCLKPASGSLM